MSAAEHSVREHIRVITDDEVNVSRNNVRLTVQKVGDILSKLPLEQHKAVMAGLGIEVELRQQAMQIAMEEYKHKQQMQQALNQRGTEQALDQQTAGALTAEKPGPVALAK